MKLFADTIAPVRRSSNEEVFLIRIVAKPLPENPEASEAGGAYVNCWVDADDLRTAEQRAIEAIEGEQWQPIKLDHWEIACRQRYVEDSRYKESERCEYLERLDESFELGISLTFDCWSPGAPDANDDDL